MEGKIIDISSLVGSVKKEFLYNEEEKKVLNKVLNYEMEDLDYICSYVDKEDAPYLKKAHSSLEAISKKISKDEKKFSFKDYDFLLGSCVEVYKKYLDSDEFSTYEFLVLRDVINKMNIIYKSFDKERDKKEKGMEL